MKPAALPLLALLAGFASAQDLELRARIEPDSLRKGPAALVWLRDHSEFEGMPGIALVLTWKSGSRPVLQPDPAPERNQLESDTRALAGELSLGGKLLGHFECSREGRESWLIDPLAPESGRVHELAAILGLPPTIRGEAQIDLAALIGALASTAACADRDATTLALLAGHCGTVRVRVSTGPGEVRVEGSSAGGLAIPALLLWQTYHEALQVKGRAFDAAEALILRAQAQRSAGREEAARQLARIADPSTREALVRLCRADDYTRVIAMDALARRGERESLPALVAAADRRMPDTIAIAKAALLENYDRLDSAERSVLDALLRGHQEAELRELPRALSVPTLAGAGGATTITEQSVNRLSLLLPLMLGLLLTLLLLVREQKRVA